MDFCGTFDDSLFAETRSRESTPLKCYNAKICVPKWFLSAEPGDENDEINLEKYRADFHYSHKDYESALTHYKKCIDLVPESNMSMRRDIFESVARCNLHLDRLEEAMKMAESLYRDAQNFEQKTNTLQLLVTVYHLRNDAKAEALAIERSILLHPMHVDLWLGLAKAYIRIDESENIAGKDSTGETEEHLFFATSDKCHYVSTCCVRVLGLLDYCERMGQTFALEKLSQQRGIVNEILDQQGVTQDFIESCSKVICMDLKSSQESVGQAEAPKIKPEQIVSFPDYDLHKYFTESWISWKMNTWQFY